MARKVNVRDIEWFYDTLLCPFCKAEVPDHKLYSGPDGGKATCLECKWTGTSKALKVQRTYFRKPVIKKKVILCA